MLLFRFTLFFCLVWTLNASPLERDDVGDDGGDGGDVTTQSSNEPATDVSKQDKVFY